MGVIDGILGLYVSDKQRNEEWQRMIQQHKWNIEDWNRQNLYNLPAEQVKRLIDAGINPVANAMSGGTDFSNTAGAMNPTQIVTPSSAAAFGSVISALGANRLQSAQAKTEDLTRMVKLENIRSQNDLMKKQLEGVQLSNEAQQILNSYLNERETWVIEGMKANVHFTYAQEANFKALTKKAQYEIENVLPEEVKKIVSEQKINALELDRLTAVIKDVYADVSLKEAQTSLAETETTTEEEKQRLLAAQSEQQQKETSRYDEVTNAVIEQYNASIDNLSAQAGLSKEETYWKVFDEIDKNSLSLFGNKLPQGRFGERWVRKNWKKSIKEKLAERFGD